MEALLYRIAVARRGSGSAEPLPLDRILVARKEIRRIIRAENFGVDPEFVSKNRALHEFLMKVYKALRVGREFISEMGGELARDTGRKVHSDHLINAFQVKYQGLHTAMTKLRDHYRQFGDVHQKWVSLVKSRYEAYGPLLERVLQRDKDQ